MSDSDLVELLKASCIYHGTDAPCRRDPPEQRCTTCKAADEIERLRKAHNGEICVDVQEHCEKVEAANRALGEKLAEARALQVSHCYEMRQALHALETCQPLRALDAAPASAPEKRGQPEGTR